MDKVEEKTDEVTQLKAMLLKANKENAALKAKLENALSGETNLNVIHIVYYTHHPHYHNSL